MHRLPQVLFIPVPCVYKHQPVQNPYTTVTEKIAQNSWDNGKQYRDEINDFHIIGLGIKIRDGIYEVQIKISRKFLHIKAAGNQQQNRQNKAGICETADA